MKVKIVFVLLFSLFLFTGSTAHAQEERTTSSPVVYGTYDTGDWHVIDVISVGERNCFVVTGTNSVVTRCFDTYEKITVSETIPLPDNSISGERSITRVKVGSLVECLVTTREDPPTDLSYSCTTDISVSG